MKYVTELHPKQAIAAAMEALIRKMQAQFVDGVDLEMFEAGVNDGLKTAIGLAREAQAATQEHDQMKRYDDLPQAGRKRTPAEDFANDLRILFSTDRHELVAAGIMDEEDKASWIYWTADPFKAAMRLGDEDLAKLWKHIEKRRS